jgi:hypothetical protein
MTRALRLLACLLLASLFVAAVHDVSQAWDVWYYHLPFAARIWGIVPEGAYAFHAENVPRWEGFPLFGEALQGLLWKVTGSPACSNLLAFSAIPLHAWFLRRTFDVPWPTTVIALVAIPMVMIHATSGYLDLPANAWASILVLLVWRLHGTTAPRDARTLAIALAAAAATVNTKFQLVPLVVVSLAALLPWLVGRSRRRLLVVAIALPLVFAKPLENLAVHGNPVYPVSVKVLGHTLPGPESEYAASPLWLASAPRPVRWACSVLEIRTTKRWTIDQWTPEDDPGYRMGGFFGPYVVLNLALFTWTLWRRRERRVRVAGVVVLGLTAMVSAMPQSHELRYYAVWMIALVSVNLALHARELPRLVGLTSAAVLASVIFVTEGTYVLPTGSTFPSLLAAKVSPDTLARLRALPPGSAACMDARPWTFLYAAPFHEHAAWKIQESATADDCHGLPRVE